VNFPSFIRSSIRLVWDSSVADLTCSSRAWRSPIPSSLWMKDSGLKVSMSWICSPVPMK